VCEQLAQGLAVDANALTITPYRPCVATVAATYLMKPRQMTSHTEIDRTEFKLLNRKALLKFKLPQILKITFKLILN